VWGGGGDSSGVFGAREGGDFASKGGGFCEVSYFFASSGVSEGELGYV